MGEIRCGVRETGMLRTRNVQPSLWESVLPEICLRLPAELERVDAWLDDERFFAPFRAYFDPRIGRPSVPMETYLRLMFLKFRYRLGYESLCAEVSDSISWRRFCRIDIDGRVPHPTTLMKITTRGGGQAGEALNEGLLAQAVARMGRLVARIKTAGGARRTAFRDRSRAAYGRVRAIASKLRLRGAAAGGPAQAAVARLTAELAGIAATSAADAAVVLGNARRAVGTSTGRIKGRLRRAVHELATLVERTRFVVTQARRRLAAQPVAAGSKLVSLHDTDARVIAKGRLGRPVEFGYQAQIVDNDDGIVLDYQLNAGNPPDAPQLAPAIARITRRTGSPPGAGTADRGYGQAAVEAELHTLGVKTVAIPRKGKPGTARRQHERRPAFRKLVKWRTGAEGRISHLKHAYGWDRSRLDGRGRTATWCGHGVLAHNLVKITRLAAQPAC